MTNDAGGFLKLSTTNEWVLGDRSAPINKKAIAKVCFSLVSIIRFLMLALDTDIMTKRMRKERKF